MSLSKNFFSRHLSPDKTRKSHLDYLKEYCEVVYLDRTNGVSSSEIRAEKRNYNIGIIGEVSKVMSKFIGECDYVNCASVIGLCTEDKLKASKIPLNLPLITSKYEQLLNKVDAVYVLSHPTKHYEHVKRALEAGKHVLCESPIALTMRECDELIELSKKKNLVLTEAIKTAYSTAYNRMILIAKGGKIGDIVSVDAICTSLKDVDYADQIQLEKTWNSLSAWGPTALLPVFQLLGVNYIDKEIISRVGNDQFKYDEFTKITFRYQHAVASIKVGKGVKSEGELIISGTKGYIYVPAPWWKTDYFEIRYENQEDNKRYFYQLDGEGIRYEILSFVKSIENQAYPNISKQVTLGISRILEDYFKGENVHFI